MIEEIDLLLEKLNIKEKIGLLSQNIYGWKCYDQNGKVLTNVLKDEYQKYGLIGSIYGILRSDPWSKVNINNGVLKQEQQKLLTKISALVKGRFDIYPFLVEEIPHGHQGLYSVTYPVNLAIGCSFNQELYQKISANIAFELRAKGANIGLLSAFDLALDPRWGRTEECFGEDTFLAKTMLSSALQGLQGDQGQIAEHKIGVVVKHFIAQGSSLGGHNGTSASLGINELKAHHLPLVECAIKQQAIGIMAAYNDIDGMPNCLNKTLLTNYLRKENNFQGLVMSDGCAVDNLASYISPMSKLMALAIKAGLDLDLWNKSFNLLPEALAKNELSIAELNRAVKVVLQAKKRLNLLSNPCLSLQITSKHYDQWQADNLQIARESIVLLKNHNILPLKNLDDVCLIGPFINNIYHQLGDYTPFKDLAKVKNLQQTFKIAATLGLDLANPQNDEQEIAKAVALAKKHQKVILNLGGSSARDFRIKYNDAGTAIVDQDQQMVMDSGEGVDLAEVALSNKQVNLFKKIYAVNQNIILIITSGRPLGLSLIAKQAKAIMQSFFGGEKIARALLETILGVNNPSGRLAISIANNSSQLPVYYWQKETKNYLDQNALPLFSFGDGLSYANLMFKTLNVEKSDQCHFILKIKVINQSQIFARWPILIFAKMFNPIIKPPQKILVGFKKITLKANQSHIFEIKIDTIWLWKNYHYQNIDFFIT